MKELRDLITWFFYRKVTQCIVSLVTKFEGIPLNWEAETMAFRFLSAGYVPCGQNFLFDFDNLFFL